MNHRVVAVNMARSSENKIHDDAVARRYGFRGGLVPGVTVYGYMTRLPAERWGREWLAAGTMSAGFRSPVYEGEEVTVAGDLPQITLSGEDGTIRATGTATLDAAPPPDLDAYPEADLLPTRPDASPETLAPGTVLGSVSATFHAAKAGEFLDAIGDDLPVYREGVAHPGWLVTWCNHILVANVRLGPWIHVSSEVQHLGLVGDGDVVTTRGCDADEFERKGHRFVVLDLVLAVGDRPVMHVRHDAIWRVRPRPPE